jgi:hypothetical protein
MFLIAIGQSNRPAELDYTDKWCCGGTGGSYYSFRIIWQKGDEIGHRTRITRVSYSAIMSHREAERRQRQRKESRPLTGLGPVFIKAGRKVWVASQVRGSTSEVQR